MRLRLAPESASKPPRPWRSRQTPVPRASSRSRLRPPGGARRVPAEPAVVGRFGRNSSRPPPSTDALRLKEGPGGQSPIRAGGSCRKRPRGHSARARRRKTRSSQSGPAAGGNEKLSSSTAPQLRKLFVAVNTDRRSSVDLDRLNRHLVGLDFLDK